MIRIKNKIHDNIINTLDKFYDPKEIVLFDIETTGFTAETTTLYLIGCAFYDNDNEYKIIQWLNDDGVSEKEIIEEFIRFIKGYKYILHYNGDGFDIPYISKKKNILDIALPFCEAESIDLYKQIRCFKDILHLDNLKQKSLEKFLGINRLDKYSGGDLIKIYKDYVKDKSEKKKQLLLQHNYDDLEGLISCFCLLSYLKFKAGCVKVTKMSVVGKKLFFSLYVEYSLPKRITTQIHDIIITGYQNEATLNIPIISEELKFFFDNYKEYYYLPAEDMAVHKSVATYVDKNYKQPAKKENCYLKHMGHYISQINNGILSGYKRDYKDKETFIELADSFLKDMDLINAYARHVIQTAFQKI